MCGAEEVGTWYGDKGETFLHSRARLSKPSLLIDMRRERFRSLTCSQNLLYQV